MPEQALRAPLPIDTRMVDTDTGMITAWWAERLEALNKALAPPLFIGHGTPETFVAATPGSLYLDLDGGAESLWYKQTGTGKTGWIPRDVFTDSPTAGGTAGARLGADALRFKFGPGDTGADGAIIYTGNKMEVHGGGAVKLVRIFDSLGVGIDPTAIAGTARFDFSIGVNAPAPNISGGAVVMTWLGVGTTTRTGTNCADFSTRVTFAGAVHVSARTASQLLATDANKELQSLAPSAHINDPGSVTETAGATYGSNEQTMLNNLKALANDLSTKLAAVLDALESKLIVSP